MNSATRHTLIVTVTLFAVLACLRWAGEASAVTIIEPPGSHFPYQQWADEAKMPTPDATLEVVETGAEHGCPGRDLNYAGCTSPQTGMIWVAPEAFAAIGPRRTFWHELGHNVDADLQPWMRERFMALLGLSGAWVVEGEPKPGDSPDELFATAWPECALKPKVAVSGGLGVGPMYGSEPLGGRRVHNAICRMLGRL